MKRIISVKKSSATKTTKLHLTNNALLVLKLEVANNILARNEIFQRLSEQITIVNHFSVTFLVS